MKPIFRPIACITSTGSAGTGAGVLLVGGLHLVHPVAGHRAVAGRVVDQLELAVAHVVVDRLRHADGDQIQPALAGPTGRSCWPCPSSRCRRCRADSPLDGPGAPRSSRSKSSVWFGSELVAAGADRAGRRGEPQQGDLLGRLGRQVEQLLLQHAFDAVPGPVDRADGVKLPGGLDDPPQTVIDHRRWPAALRDDQVLGTTHNPYPCCEKPRFYRYRQGQSRTAGGSTDRRQIVRHLVLFLPPPI